MKKLILFLLLFVMVIPEGYALCKEANYNELVEKAKKAELKESGNRILGSNIDKDVLVFYNNTYYTGDEKGELSMPKVDDTDEINLYGGFDTKCNEEFLYAVKVQKEDKINNSNIVMIILIIAVIGVLGFVAYKDYEKRDKNEKK